MLKVLNFLAFIAVWRKICNFDPGGIFLHLRNRHANLAKIIGADRIGTLKFMTTAQITAPYTPDLQQTSHPESSVIELSMHQSDYLASLIARAVEDADTYLLDLNTSTAPDGMMTVRLCVSNPDPASAVRSLERYGFNVTSASGPADSRLALAAERIDQLQLYLNI